MDFPWFVVITVIMLLLTELAVHDKKDTASVWLGRGMVVLAVAILWVSDFMLEAKSRHNPVQNRQGQ